MGHCWQFVYNHVVVVVVVVAAAAAAAAVVVDLLPDSTVILAAGKTYPIVVESGKIFLYINTNKCAFKCYIFMNLIV